VEREKPRTNCAHRSWDLADSVATPEPYYLRRAEFLRVFGLGLAASALLPPAIRAEMALQECLEMNWFDKPAGGRA
jgi:hypothetical protein